MGTEAHTFVRPRLAGGNTIQQAQKPSTTPISLPSTPFSVTSEDFSRIADLADQRAQRIVELENTVAKQADRIHELRSQLARLKQAG